MTTSPWGGEGMRTFERGGREEEKGVGSGGEGERKGEGRGVGSGKEGGDGGRKERGGKKS